MHCSTYPRHWLQDKILDETLNVINVRYSHHYSFCTGDCIRFSSVTQLCLTLATPWTVARQASLSITNSWSLPKHMSIEIVMPSNHLILCHFLLFLPSIFPNIRVFTDESAFCIRWPKYWSFSFSISPSNEHPGLISFRVDWFDLLIVRGTLKSHLELDILECEVNWGLRKHHWTKLVEVMEFQLSYFKS